MSAWLANLMADDEKARSGKEYEASKRLSNVLCSDKIAEPGFCENILPKIIDRYASLVEENSRKHMQERDELKTYELWYLMPGVWGYEI